MCSSNRELALRQAQRGLLARLQYMGLKKSILGRGPQCRRSI